MFNFFLNHQGQYKYFCLVTLSRKRTEKDLALRFGKVYSNSLSRKLFSVVSHVLLSPKINSAKILGKGGFQFSFPPYNVPKFNLRIQFLIALSNKVLKCIYLNVCI